MDPRIFGLDAQTLFDTCITLIAMLILFILLSYLLFNPARKLIEKRKAYIKEQLDEAAEAKESALSMKEEYDNKLAKKPKLVRQRSSVMRMQRHTESSRALRRKPPLRRIRLEMRLSRRSSR